VRDHDTTQSYFANLGRRVHERWLATDFDGRTFPEIALAALREAPPSENVTYEEVVHAFAFGTGVPDQRPERAFGRPPITVFRTPRFYIEVLCWMDGTTAIHQHAFSGAFHVLEGSSLHSRYRFEVRRAVSHEVELGELVFAEAEVLRAGDSRPIHPGRELIHALFHLDRPSISVVVRTRFLAGHTPQWLYLPPHLAIDPLAEQTHESTPRLVEILDAFVAARPAAYDRLLDRLVAERELLVVFQAIQHAYDHATSPPFDVAQERVAALLDAARARFGAPADAFRPTLEASGRIASIATLRNDVVDVDHRFFLALLMNLPSRAAILDQVAARVPGDPAATAVRWLRELVKRRSPTAVSVLDLEIELDEPLPGVALDELVLKIAEAALTGASGEALHARLAAGYPGGELTHLAEDVRGLEEGLRSGALKALLDPG